MQLDVAFEGTDACYEERGYSQNMLATQLVLVTPCFLLPGFPNGLGEPTVISGDIWRRWFPWHGLLLIRA